MFAAILGAIVTALIWGITDPLMKKFGSDPKSIDNWITRTIPFLSNWRFAVTFVVNQVGSITFLWTLNKVGFIQNLSKYLTLQLIVAL